MQTTIDNAVTCRRAVLLFAETVLRPIIRILLRYGLSFPEFNRITRRIYVDLAMQESEFRMPRRRRQYKSRVALLTGLSRKEVLRLLESPRPVDDPDFRSANRAARVLHGWLSDARYLDEKGEPLPLSFRSSAGRRSFSELVNLYSGDVPPRAILDELRRAGCCDAEGDDEIRVRNRHYFARPIDVDALSSAAMKIANALSRAETGLLPQGGAENDAVQVHAQVH